MSDSDILHKAQLAAQSLAELLSFDEAIDSGDEALDQELHRALGTTLALLLRWNLVFGEQAGLIRIRPPSEEKARRRDLS